MSFYSRTNSDTGSDFGSIIAKPLWGLYVGTSAAYNAGNTTYYSIKDHLVPNSRTPETTVTDDTRGFFVQTVAEGKKPLYRNGIQKLNDSLVVQGFGFNSFTGDAGGGSIVILARKYKDFVQMFL